MTRSKTLLFVLALAVGVLTFNSALRADTVYQSPTDPQLQIGPCTAGFPNCGGSPNTITGTEVQIYDNAKSSADTLGDTLLLVLAIPTSVFTTAPTIDSTFTLSSGGGGTSTLGGNGGTAYSGTWNATTGVATDNGGIFDNTFNPPKGTPNALYGFVGFDTPDGGSYNLTNFNAAESAAGITGGSYDVLVYTLTITSGSLNKGGYADVLFSSLNAMPSGTIVGAYGCIATGINAGPPQTCSSGDEAVPIWTTAGFVNSSPIPFIPEPASLAMMGSGLLTLGLVLRRKLRS